MENKIRIILLIMIMLVLMLVSMTTEAPAHEGHGWFHRSGSIKNIVGMRVNYGMESWCFQDNGGPYYNLYHQKLGWSRYDEITRILFIHNKVHYYAPQLVYERTGQY